jgi:hypothetical protein
MFRDKSNKPRIDPEVEQLFDEYKFEYFPEWPTSELPLQRCSDANYISDIELLDWYRNLDYRMIQRTDYHNRVIKGMVLNACWLVTSAAEKGIQSPLNMYEWDNIHPGKKRYIVANYLGLDSVPVLSQFQGEGQGGIPITNMTELSEIYGDQFSARIKHKPEYNERLLECSWHGETQMRDDKGYDDWHAAAGEALQFKNKILDDIMANGIYINPAEDLPFYIEVYNDAVLEYDLMQLYYHFDPRVGGKIDKKLGISIINHYGDPDWVTEVDFSKTLNRPWLPDPEKT